MPSIKFYYAPGACSLAPHILLREVGLDFEPIPTRINESGSFPEEFRLVNPKMRVPVLVIDGTAVTEVPAIVTLISTFAPDMALTGRTPLETAAVYEWMNWLSGTLHGLGYGTVLRPQRYSDDPSTHEGIQAKGRESVRDSYGFIERKLAGVYAVGDAPTTVEPYLFVFYRWGNSMGFEMQKNYPKYTALIENLVQRPAVKATLKVENIDSTL
jgi:glutathione S-transferase